MFSLPNSSICELYILLIIVKLSLCIFTLTINTIFQDVVCVRIQLEFGCEYVYSIVCRLEHVVQYTFFAIVVYQPMRMWGHFIAIPLRVFHVYARRNNITRWVLSHKCLCHLCLAYFRIGIRRSIFLLEIRCDILHIIRVITNIAQIVVK